MGTFLLGGPVRTYQTASSGGSGLKGLMRNPHSSFAACSPPDRKRMRRNNAPVRDRAVDTINAAPFRIAPAGTPPTLKTSAMQNVERRNNFWLLPSCPHKLHILAFRIGKDILLFGPLQQVRCKKLKLIFLKIYWT